jgi:SAM-dependent methyltransferase
MMRETIQCRKKANREQNDTRRRVREWRIPSQSRKVAASVAGVEPELSARKFIANSGIEVVPSTSELREHYDVITVFHVLEHIKDPRHFISLLADHLAENGKIIVEVPNADDALLSLYRNVPFSFFTYWSCHLYLFTRTTLTMLAKQAGLTVDYVKQVQRYPLSNHLFWLACGKPGGHKYWVFSIL